MDKNWSVPSDLEIREQNVCVHQSCCSSSSFDGLGLLGFKVREKHNYVCAFRPTKPLIGLKLKTFIYLN